MQVTAGIKAIIITEIPNQVEESLPHREISNNMHMDKAAKTQVSISKIIHKGWAVDVRKLMESL